MERADLPPYVALSATSQAAAISKKDQREADKKRVEQFVKSMGAGGTTCDNAEVRLGIHQSISARFNDLVHDGKIIPTTRQRKTRHDRNAFVYVHTDLFCDHCYVILVGHSKGHRNGTS